jgi:hypothetical protein
LGAFGDSADRLIFATLEQGAAVDFAAPFLLATILGRHFGRNFLQEFLTIRLVGGSNGE